MIPMESISKFRRGGGVEGGMLHMESIRKLLRGIVVKSTLFLLYFAPPSMKSVRIHTNFSYEIP
jgi:hypothetical protein